MIERSSGGISGNDGNEGGRPARKKKRSRGPVIIGVVLAVAIAAYFVIQ